MELLLKSAPEVLQKAWSPLKLKLNFPLKYSRGLVTDTTIPKNQIIASTEDCIPGNKLLHSDELKAHFAKDVLEYAATLHPDIPNMLERLKLAFQISSILRNKGSRLNDYCESLPTSNLPFPFYWNKPGCSFSVYMQNLLAQEITAIKDSYEKIYDLEKKALASMSFEEFYWTHTMVLNRSLELSEGLYIVPFMDSVNHSFEPNCEIVKEKDTFVLKSTQEIPEDQELFRDYGKLDNYEFAMRYGFVPENNPYDCFYAFPENFEEWNKCINFAKLHQKEPITELENPNNYSYNSLKKKLFEKWNCSDLQRAVLPKDPPASDLEVAYRIFFLQMDDLKELGKTSVDQAFEVDFTKEVAVKNERRMKTLILKLVDFHIRCQPEEMEGESELGKKLERTERKILFTYLEHYRKLLV